MGNKTNRPLEVLPSKKEKTLFSWVAPARPFKKRDREFWTTAFWVLALVCLILFLLREWFIIGALGAFVFLYYVLTTVPPEDVKYRITTKGVYLPGTTQRIAWEWFRSFWFSQKWGFTILNLETWLDFPRVIHLVIWPKDRLKIRRLLKDYLSEEQEEEKRNFLDRLAGWLWRHLPFPSEQTNSPQTNKT